MNDNYLIFLFDEWHITSSGKWGKYVQLMKKTLEPDLYFKVKDVKLN
jgi:hypothetical protein